VLGKLTEVDMPAQAGDFRLVDRCVLQAMKSMREHRRYIRGMFAWAGFKQTAVLYHREERTVGRTKFNYWKLYMSNDKWDGKNDFTDDEEALVHSRALDGGDADLWLRAADDGWTLVSEEEADGAVRQFERLVPISRLAVDRFD
jgi:hypothetical protein